MHKGGGGAGLLPGSRSPLLHRLIQATGSASLMTSRLSHSSHRNNFTDTCWNSGNSVNEVALSLSRSKRPKFCALYVLCGSENPRANSCLSATSYDFIPHTKPTILLANIYFHDSPCGLIEGKIPGAKAANTAQKVAHPTWRLFLQWNTNGWHEKCHPVAHANLGYPVACPCSCRSECPM